MADARRSSESPDSLDSPDGLPPDLEHPKGTLAIVIAFGLFLGLAWLCTYVFVFLERGAPHH